MTVLRTNVHLLRCNASFRDPWTDIESPSPERNARSAREASHQLRVTSSKFVQIGNDGSVRKNLVSASIASTLVFSDEVRLELEHRIILECEPDSPHKVEIDKAREIVRRSLKESAMEIAVAFARTQINLTGEASLSIDLRSLAEMARRLDEMFDTIADARPTSESPPPPPKR